MAKSTTKPRSASRKYISIEGAAKLLGMSADEVEKLVDDGLLPVLPTRTGRVILDSDVIEFAKSRQKAKPVGQPTSQAEDQPAVDSRVGTARRRRNSRPKPVQKIEVPEPVADQPQPGPEFRFPGARAVQQIPADSTGQQVGPQQAPEYLAPGDGSASDDVSVLRRLRRLSEAIDRRQDRGADRFGPNVEGGMVDQIEARRSQLNKVIQAVGRSRIATNKARRVRRNPGDFIDKEGATYEAAVRGIPNPRTVVVNGKEIALPDDYRERKKFRKYQQEELQKIAGARRRRKAEDSKTDWQLKGAIGRAGFRAGRGTRRVTNAVVNEFKASDWPLPPNPFTKRNPLVRFGLQYNRNMGGPAGIALALGALAGGAVIGSNLKSEREAEEERKRRLAAAEAAARRDMLDVLGRREYKQTIKDSINENLGRLRAQAPDIYMRMASGRLLPQGAVVIGGAPRSDLLNELGMAMANGQFNG